MRRPLRSVFVAAASCLSILKAGLALAQPMGQGDPSFSPPVGAPGASPGTPAGEGPRRPPPDNTPLPRREREARENPATPCTTGRVIAVRFVGLQHVSSVDIRDSVRVHAGSCFSRPQLSRDARSLWDLGFFSDVQVAAEPTEQGGLEVRFTLAERPSIHEVRLDGRDALEEDKVREVIDLREGAVLSESAVRRNAQNIRDLYAERGYFLAEVRGEVVRRPGTDNEADVVYHIRENAQVQVRSINFVGNASIPADDLRGAMTTGQSSFFSFLTGSGTYREEAFRNDVDMLHAVYYDRGFLNVEIDNPRVALSADRRFLDITVLVREGPRYKVGRLRVVETDEDGNEIEPLGGRRRVRDFFHVAPGDYFSRAVIGRDILALQTHYRDAGYATVDVQPDIQPNVAGRTVDLALRIQRGALTYVHRVVIRGNQKTADRVIRRELMILEGDRYSETRYNDSKRRVQQLGYFERVDMSTEPLPDHPDRIVVNVEVVERPTGTFQIGAGFSSVENFIATAQIQQLNLFGRGQALTLQAQVSSLRQIFMLRFLEPYLWDSNWTGALDLYNTLRVYPEFARSSTGGSISLGYPLIGTNDLRLAATYTGEYVGVSTSAFGGAFFGTGGTGRQSQFAGIPLPNLFQNGFTSAVGLSMTVDTRNDRLYPTSGIYARAGVEVADPYLGSENVYTRWSGFFRFYLPLFAGIVFKSNIAGGLVTSRQGRVPIFERYFLGGILDVRGFRLRTIGPRLQIPSTLDPNAAVTGLGPNIGGNLQMYYNLELEFPILEKVGVRGVLFSDGGNVFNTEAIYCNASRGSFQDNTNDVINPCVVNPLALRTSWGVGIRWFSPLGLLRFEWGFPFVRLPGEEPNVFEFTIGNFF